MAGAGGWASRWLPVVAASAAAGSVAAAMLAGQAVEGYSHLHHPLALLGARQQPHSMLVGLFVFVLPGLAGAWVALDLRGRLPPEGTRWPARIGAQLALLAALAFAAQGLLPLDLDNLDAGDSRYHAGAWMLWALAFPVGAVLLAAGLWRVPGWRGFAVATLLAGVLVPAGGFLAGHWWAAAQAQRLAFAIWLGWGVFAAVACARVSRGAA